MSDAGLVNENRREEPSAFLTHYIIQALRDEGASHVFLVPGGYVDNFSEAMVAVKGITPIVCASESGAAYMADGFARTAGRFSVCMGISGPGASNMLTGLTLSDVDQTPVLVITGDAPLSWRDRDAIQDPGIRGLKTTQLLATVCTQQIQVQKSGLIENYLHRLMTTLKGPKTGVAHLAVPMDVQQHRVNGDYLPSSELSTNHSRTVDVNALNLAMQMLADCKRIVILAGAGVRRTGAFQALQDFAEQYKIPVATTMSAKGDFPEDHALSMGVFGWAGTGIANETLLGSDIDALLVIGCRLGQIDTFCWNEKLAQGRTLIQIDSLSEHLNRTYVADLSLVSDEQAALTFMLKSDDLLARDKLMTNCSLRENWLLNVRQGKTWFYHNETTHFAEQPIHPARAISELQTVMPEKSALFVDNGAHTFFATHYWTMRHPNHYFNVINYSGAMGWAISASIGSKIARPETPVIAVVGDGCMLMQGMEIQTAARYGLRGIVFVVLNNKAHGNPKLRASGFSDAAAELTNIVDHDWAAFAQALGVKGLTVSNPDQLASVFKQAYDMDQAVLVDVKCGLYPTPTKVFDETFMTEFNRFIHNRIPDHHYAE